MRPDVATAMSRSSEDFLRLVWPQIGARFGEIIPVESVTANDFARELDARAGIDIWLIGGDGHMRGLASRVQWTDSPYNTFTVRVRTRNGGPTEYHKRKAEIAASGATIRPHYVAQAYISLDRTRLLSAALGRMEDVIAAVDLDMGWLMPPNGDGTQGYAIRWSRLRESGAKVQTWPYEQGLILD